MVSPNTTATSCCECFAFKGVVPLVAQEEEVGLPTIVSGAENFEEKTKVTSTDSQTCTSGWLNRIHY